MGSRNNRMIGYHANDEERCIRFLKDEKYLIIGEDTEYLGKGMYFWEHLHMAKWWKEEKKKDLIVQATVNIDNLLDLTNREQVEQISNLYNILNRAIKNRLEKKYNGKNIDILVGVKLDEIFDSYPEIMSKFEVVRCQRNYDQFDEPDFFFNTKLTTLCTSIYCVKVVKPISKREQVA